MKRSRIWITAAVLLAFIWTAVAFVMHETGPLVSWPEKVQALMAEAPWLNGEEGTHEARQQHLDRVITNYNRLDAPQRRRFREDFPETLDSFLASLTDEEKKEYASRTLEPFFNSISQGLKRMPDEDRKRLIGRLRGDLKSLRATSPDGDRLSEQDREFMDLMIAEDPVLFLREAPLKVKLELAPVLEDLQTRLHGMRR